MALNQPTPIHLRQLKCHMLDISAANSPAYVAVPWKCKIIRLGVILHGPISGADSVVTCSVVSAGVAVAITGGTITAANASSAAGSEFSASPTAITHALEGDAIGFVSDGASSTTASATCYALVDLTGDN